LVFSPQMELAVGTWLVSLSSIHYYTWVLGTWFVARFVVYIFTSVRIIVTLCECFITIFTAYFLLISFRLILMSGVYTCKKLRALRARGNSTDRATAACRRS
jgi:hypothetical protein